METIERARFTPGEKVKFLGSKYSYYGNNRKSDKHIGKIVTIDAIHPTGRPYAYTFKEFTNEINQEYWFPESCFEEVLIELPEFEAEGSVELLFG